MLVYQRVQKNVYNHPGGDDGFCILGGMGVSIQPIVQPVFSIVLFKETRYISQIPPPEV